MNGGKQRIKTMTKPFKQLRDKMSPEKQARAQAKTRVMLEEMALNELRQAFELSQEDMASRLNVKQPAISKIEKNTDMYISTLRRFIEAMGGELDISARFNDELIHINQFEDFRDKITS
jgi:DNA-binding XRE family transcriptional regulator